MWSPCWRRIRPGPGRIRVYAVAVLDPQVAVSERHRQIRLVGHGGHVWLLVREGVRGCLGVEDCNSRWWRRAWGWLGGEHVEDGVDEEEQEGEEEAEKSHQHGGFVHNNLFTPYEKQSGKRWLKFLVPCTEDLPPPSSNSTLHRRKVE